MSSPSVALTLGLLEEDASECTQAGLVVRWMPAIARARSSGVRLKAIHKALQETHGLTLSYPSFKSACSRVRMRGAAVAARHPALPGAGSGDPEGRELPALPAAGVVGGVAAGVASSDAGSPAVHAGVLVHDAEVASEGLPVAGSGVSGVSAADRVSASADTLGARALMRRWRSTGVMPPAESFNDE